jgi:dihydroneopterin aldolase
MDKILLSGVRIGVHIGVSPEERSLPQTVIADIECEKDLHPAGISDDVADTVDYALMHQAMLDVATQGPYALVETFAETIATTVLEHFEVQSVRVLVRKPSAFRSHGVDWAGVEIVRRRD